MNSTELVPGDLFELPEDEKVLPCDAILLNGNKKLNIGSVIVNESVLTGESTPIVKSHIHHTHHVFNLKKDKKNILFAGTKIIQKRALDKSKVLAIVLSTGFNTEKGNLIRTILYPKEMDSKFQSDSVKFLIFMGVISIIGFGISLPYMIEYGLNTIDIVYRTLDLFTTSVPPELPACIGIGISYAISRLKKHGITCIARERTNIAGRVNLICFDKTGTLTEDHLDIYGFRSVSFINNIFLFNEFQDRLIRMREEVFEYYHYKMSNNGKSSFILDKQKDINSFFIENLATCHTLNKVNDKLIGDPVDLKMFETTGWIFNETEEKSDHCNPVVTIIVRPGKERDLKEKLNENPSDEETILNMHYELGIVRRFEYSSKLMRMSVLVRNVNEPYFKVYTKGSPESIKEICREDTIPPNYKRILSNYAIQGFRVLAFSMKMVKMDYMLSQTVERKELECNMIFLGLLIVQNKLKPQTKSSLETLKQARLRMIMSTGDNLLTGISVAKESGLINPDLPIFLVEINEENKLVWNPVDTFLEDDQMQQILNKFNNYSGIFS